MPELEIYFAGLICHYGPSNDEISDRKTLVQSILLHDGPDHVARILTSLDTTPPPSGNPYDAFGTPLKTGVRFTGLGDTPEALKLFNNSVPHLDDLTRSGIEGYNDPPPGFVVQLPKGQFTVVLFYKYGAMWVLDGDKYTRLCVPRVTMLSTSGSNVSVYFNRKNIDFKKDGWILITNLEKDAQKPPYYKEGDDWKKQSAATTGDEDDIADYYNLRTVKSNDGGSPPPLRPECETPAASGRWTSEVLPLFDDIRLIDTSECTNTHWP